MATPERVITDTPYPGQDRFSIHPTRKDGLLIGPFNPEILDVVSHPQIPEGLDSWQQERWGPAVFVTGSGLNNPRLHLRKQAAIILNRAGCTAVRSFTQDEILILELASLDAVVGKGFAYILACDGLVVPDPSTCGPYSQAEILLAEKLGKPITKNQFLPDHLPQTHHDPDPNIINAIFSDPTPIVNGLSFADYLYAYLNDNRNCYLDGGLFWLQARLTEPLAHLELSKLQPKPPTDSRPGVCWVNGKQIKVDVVDFDEIHNGSWARFWAKTDDGRLVLHERDGQTYNVDGKPYDGFTPKPNINWLSWHFPNLSPPKP